VAQKVICVFRPLTICTRWWLCYIGPVNTQEIITALDAEIARLQEVRSFIAGSSNTRRRGRPPASASPVVVSKRRKLSPEARKKIAAAQRKRWAKQKAAKPVQVTKVPPKKERQNKPRSAK
jgi:hypothetical protein